MRKASMLLTVLVLMSMPALAQDEEAELAKKLANPVASLIQVPFVANYDENIGPDEEGAVWLINIQPVIPFSLSEDWNLISRTILPVIDQNDVPVQGMGASGIGDLLPSLFFSPVKSGGLTWGVGPVFLLPTASDEMLGGGKWGIGPTAVLLKQQGPWTVGGLVSHVESVAGKDDRADISATLIQPFLTYIIRKTKTTIALNTESIYDWENEEWLVPINFNVFQLLKVGTQIIQVGAGVRYWVDSPDGAADGWGARTKLTLLFPR